MGEADLSDDYFVGIFLGLFHGCLDHFVDNANYASLFTMELEKFLMNDKSIASCSLPRIKTKVTNNKNKL